MTATVQSRVPLDQCHVISACDQYVAVFAKYCRAYYDVIAMAGFQHVANVARLVS